MAPASPQAAAILPTMPELSIAKKNDQMAAAKVALFAYNRRTREPIWQSGLSESRSIVADRWFMGAGPFHKGSIYNGKDKGQVKAPSFGSDEGDSTKPEYFVERRFADPTKSLAETPPTAKPAVATAATPAANPPVAAATKPSKSAVATSRPQLYRRPRQRLRPPRPLLRRRLRQLSPRRPQPRPLLAAPAAVPTVAVPAVAAPGGCCARSCGRRPDGDGRTVDAHCDPNRQRGAGRGPSNTQRCAAGRQCGGAAAAGSDGCCQHSDECGEGGPSVNTSPGWAARQRAGRSHQPIQRIGFRYALGRGPLISPWADTSKWPS